MPAALATFSAVSSMAPPANGILVEVVPHPVLGVAAATDAGGVRVDDVGTVARTVTGDSENTLAGPGLEFARGGREHPCRGGAGLGETVVPVIFSAPIMPATQGAP